MPRKTNHHKGVKKRNTRGKSLSSKIMKGNKMSTKESKERLERFARAILASFDIVCKLSNLNFSEQSKQLEQNLSFKDINLTYVKNLVSSNRDLKNQIEGADVGIFHKMKDYSWIALTTKIRSVIKQHGINGINFEQPEIEVETLLNGKVRIFRKLFADKLLKNLQNIVAFLRTSKKGKASDVKQKRDMVEDEKQVKRKMLDLQKEGEGLIQPRAFFELILARLETIKENGVVPPNLTSSSGSLLWSVKKLQQQNWHQDWSTAHKNGEKWEGYQKAGFYEGSVIVAAHKASKKEPMFLHFKEKMNDSEKEEKMIKLYPGDAVMFDGDVIHAGDKWRGHARERVFLYVANGQSKAPKIQVREKNGDKKLVVSAGTHL